MNTIFMKGKLRWVVNLIVIAGFLFLGSKIPLDVEKTNEEAFTGFPSSKGLIVRATILLCSDGDTCRANIWGWPPVVGENIPIRIRDIDSPEIRGKCDKEKWLALEAKEYANGLLKGKTVKLKKIERGSFFRLVASIQIEGEDFGSLMVKEGHARSYSVKEGRKPWC